MTKSRPQVTFVASVVMFIASLVVASSGRAVAQDPTAKPLTSERLEQLVAPIALYPDSLLSQVLMASTYPLEVVEAARWSRDNANVTGQALEDAMQKQPWAPSVKALTAVPQTLQMMDAQLRWTQDLGDAFLAQHAEVLEAVQRLRQRADKTGNLKSTPQVRVTRVNRPASVPATGRAPATAYTIEPTDPNVYYVPIYDPGVVYGPWPYPDYWPFYWYPPGYVGDGWWGFGTGFFVGAAIWAGVNWWNRNVYVDHRRYNQFNRANINNPNWRHDVAHRRGVPYGNANVAKQFGDQGRGKAREAARQKVAQGMGGMGQGAMGKGAMGMGGMGQGGMGMGGAMGMGSGMAMGGGMGMGGMVGGARYRGGMAASFRGAMGFSGAMAGGFRGASFRGGRSGGFRGGGGGRGGRRSDAALKHDVSLLGYLDNGLGFYRFAYHGSQTAYVGVMAQEVQLVMPEAVVRGRDGYLRVFYDKLGLTFQTYDQWVGAGAKVPSVTRQQGD